MLSSIAVALRPGRVQREVDHRPQGQCGSQGIALGQGFRCGHKQLIAVPIDFAVAVNQKPAGAVRRRPVQKEAKGGQQAPMRRGVGYCPFLGFDILEIGKQFQKAAQVVRREIALETGPTESLRLVLAIKRLKNFEAGRRPGPCVRSPRNLWLGLRAPGLHRNWRSGRRCPGVQPPGPAPPPRRSRA